AKNGDCRNPGGAADRAIHRAGSRSGAAAQTLGPGTIPVQDVAISCAGSTDDDRLAVAVLANGTGTEVGVGADCPGNCGISDLVVGQEAVAVCEGGACGFRYVTVFGKQESKREFHRGDSLKVTVAGQWPCSFR